MKTMRALASVAAVALAGGALANDGIAETATGYWWDAAVPARTRAVALPEPRQLTTTVSLASPFVVAIAGIGLSVVSRRGEDRR